MNHVRNGITGNVLITQTPDELKREPHRQSTGIKLAMTKTVTKQKRS